MKIISLVRAHSDNSTSAFRTEPALTKEIFDHAIKFGLGEEFAKNFRFQNGLFVVKSPTVQSEMIALYEIHLSKAETDLAQQKAQAEKTARNSFIARANLARVELE